jgi:GNAT superfamily N-acetyltransferase
VRIRPISPTDKQALQEGLQRLSPRSRQLRFLQPKPRFTSAELAYVTEVDGRNHVALVAELPDGTLAAVGRWVRDPRDATYAELAITVCDEMQGQGLGTLLGLALTYEAYALGVQHFTAVMAPDNTSALKLFRRLTHHLHTEIHDGVREMVADLAA